MENLINMMAGRDQPMDYDLSFDNPRKSYQYKSWSMTVVRSRLEVNERSKCSRMGFVSFTRSKISSHYFVYLGLQLYYNENHKKKM